jgi:outer membrane protein TolC
MAADHASAAANANAKWNYDDTRVAVIKAYFGAILAQEKVKTLEAALKAGQAHVDQAEKMLKAGLVTRSDVLLASVKSGEVESQLIRARGEALIAKRQLAVVIGTPDDSLPALPPQLPGYASVHQLLQAEIATRNERSDVVAAEQQVRASDYDVRRTISLYAPRVNGFARYDWNSPNTVFDGDHNWTVGIMASWTPFAGASEWAERRAASARQTAARAGRDGARAQAALELAAAENDVRVAIAELEVAERSAAQAAEAHRIVARKYEGGLGSVTELLDAAAIETQSKLGAAAARFQGIVAQAERIHASGGDTSVMADMIQTERQEASK